MALKPTTKVVLRKMALAVFGVGLLTLSGNYALVKVTRPIAERAALEVSCKATWRGIPAQELVDIDPECAAALLHQ